MATVPVAPKISIEEQKLDELLANGYSVVSKKEKGKVYVQLRKGQEIQWIGESTPELILWLSKKTKLGPSIRIGTKYLLPLIENGQNPTVTDPAKGTQFAQTQNPVPPPAASQGRLQGLMAGTTTAVPVPQVGQNQPVIQVMTKDLPIVKEWTSVVHLFWTWSRQKGYEGDFQQWVNESVEWAYRHDCNTTQKAGMIPAVVIKEN